MQVSPNNGCYFGTTAYHTITIPQNTNTGQRYAWLSITDQCSQTYTRLVGYHACSGGYNSYAKAYPNPASTVLNVVYGAEAQVQETINVQTLYLQYKQAHPNEIVMSPEATILTLPVVANTGNIRIQLFNSLGIALIDVTKLLSTNSTVLDTSKIPNGTYFLHLTQNGNTQESQIIIQH